MAKAVTRLLKEYKAFQDSQDTLKGIAIKQDPDSLLIWHFVLYDFPPDSPYQGGVYHGILTYPSEYPFKPPNIKILTPNGRFEPDMSLCFSISDYHPETWNPAWNMRTILLAFYNFMQDKSDPATTGTVRANSAQRQLLARQ
eukprot:Protomagalhaensia_wolfi_Nauph_80__4344@NODE_443_length_2515_cov_105_813813_g333_i0_p4_GENE_NODE_443_length_2515_cov_105_813813_g333_i0NODE_443_length_2515_cov_105_813813_g333_i0_p4_ORF_typecomplete_len142_score15_08UQ_con/PF00179_26/2_1e23ProkE2_B/PF14461_6/6_3e05RWD/PF05773_22/0_097_NODE_443_length_2515_cov_105_813813_g333_i027452